MAFSGSAFAIIVIPTNDAGALASNISGSGITISNVSSNLKTNYTSAGTFTGGLSSGIGIDSGIVLTSGNAGLIDNINNDDYAGGLTGNDGDADLNALIPGYSTHDSTILEFDFESAGGDLFFNYVFASEEYNEYVNSSFNDVFGFFLDGVNIALIPGTTKPVAINTVNNGYSISDIEDPLPGVNPSPYSAFYNNNDPSNNGTFLFEYDGFTDVFTAQALGLTAGTHHIKLAIADAGDQALDSGVFIQAGSFSDTPTNPVPEPATMILLGSGLAGLAGLRKRFKK